MTDPMTRPQPAREPRSSPLFRSAIRTTTCGTAPDRATCSTSCSPISGKGTHTSTSTVFVECMSEYRSSRSRGAASGRRDRVRRAHRAPRPSAAGAGTPRVAAGIISYADLTLGAAVDQVLEAHLAASPRFRGIRHASGWDASPDVRNSHTNPPEHLLLDSKFREGFARLARYGLVFDSWQYHPQLADLADLARAFPGTTIILDHVGGPLGIGPYEGRHAEVFRDWKRGVEAVAACPNVVVKLGGIAMPINGFGWHKLDAPPSSEQLAASQRPYHETCIELFGPERCMFESNFPVDRVSCSYSTLWNAFKRVASGASPSEKAALFHDTAARVYRVQPAAKGSAAQV